MKILLVNNYHFLDGGAERYYFSLAKMLRSEGHKVAYFSMKSKRNRRTRWEKYFVSEIDLNKTNLKGTVRKMLRMIYCWESKRMIKKILDDFKPDIVHINNIHYYISPSILPEIKKRKIPIVQTVHDYQLISPNLILFANGQICEITKPNKYYKAVLSRNIKGPYVASLIAVCASYFQHIFSLYEKTVSVFILPSTFMGKKLKEYKFNYNKIVKLPNFVIKTKKYNSAGGKLNKRYVLYFGRLSEHKGIMTTVKVAKELPDVRFKLIGNFVDKSFEKRIKKYLSENKIKNVSIVKHQSPSKLKKSISEASFVIVPSKWYENQPFSIMESYAEGRTVIASNIGGIPEIVIHGKTGLLFKPNDIVDFEQKILSLWNNPIKTLSMGNYAKSFVEREFSSKNHYSKLIKIYRTLINEN
jgi:glycosyltransferase involved in cell wall biosynthesis